MRSLTPWRRKTSNSAERNCGPLSEVRILGGPKVANARLRAVVTLVVVVLLRMLTMGYLEN